MEGRGSVWAFAWAEDSRIEAFEALRASVRMLGVRKGGLGVKVSLFGKELILPVHRLVAQASRGKYFLLPARVTLLAQEKAWWEGGRRGRREYDEISDQSRKLGMRQLGEKFQDSRPAARAGREETVDVWADCFQSAIALDFAIINTHLLAH